MTTAAAAAVMAVAVASPAQAALTVRADWRMGSVPDMVDSSTDGVDNKGTTSDITMSSGYYAFNGTTSIASVPHAENLNPYTKTIKVVAKVKVATAPAAGETYDVIRKGISSTAGGYYKIELKGKTGGGMNAACIFKDKNKVVAQAIAGIATGSWQTITCTKTATKVTLVINGSLKATTTKSVGEIANTSGLYVGGKGDGSDVLSGLMDFARISIA